ncbi:hypothetical protein F5Y13DRAFT_173430 [Hypoxylon sp. FL1857]|nr:hypothetical protein F5Y13DRAFT_173430 [Hypoxylon sp. FL1857]
MIYVHHHHHHHHHFHRAVPSSLYLLWCCFLRTLSTSWGIVFVYFSYSEHFKSRESNLGSGSPLSLILHYIHITWAKYNRTRIRRTYCHFSILSADQPPAY